MRTILAVSPHLDDAVLSYGGRLAEFARSGHPVIVYTVFAGVPQPPYSDVADHYHRLWGVSGSPVPARILENEEAIARVGAVPIDGRHLDAIYRKDDLGRWLIADSSAPANEQPETADEPELLDHISQDVVQLISDHDPSLVFTCVAIGDHVDHRRARDATARATRVTGSRLRLWEDLPYGVLGREIPHLPGGVRIGSPIVEDVSSGDWRLKREAMECYTSQLPLLASMLKSEGTEVAEQLADHARTDRAQVYSERVWEVEFASSAS
jgi:LmbE family N-acetylglucosaminyl deacetylase